MNTRLLKTLENLMVAVTFAEYNQIDYAIKLMDEDNKQQPQRAKKKNLTNQSDNRPQMRL